ncbi:peptide ABC transporter substrate-binding protein [Alicyclobacillus sp. SO9]|uniref:peptide ABC transporter substrate-binding protein n=1 Tax=Alicyclobacillus sp. SO9 TaxID=2665646 RepID=UPI0018E89A5C|nr:peptide ABC transporter substrate-binding protein [Alicyclobacillus sp. SO9]QQE78239.1 peptide ABC transporter substrate-binding protein [Alicyclobacillus sp. SO9]
MKRYSVYKRRVGIFMGIVLVGSLSGCGSKTHTASAANTSNANASTSSSSSSTSSHGGTVVQALGPLVSINWYLPLRPVAYNSLYDAWAASLMYKGLFHLNASGKIDYSRSIASNVSWNSKGTVYTVKMNPKWKWSNGTPVTASDVAFTWNLIKAASAPTAPRPWPYAGAGSGGIPAMIQGFKVLGTHEFQVTLKKPVNQLWFEYNGLSDFTPLPKAAWDKYPTNLNKELSYLASNGNNASFFKVIDGPFILKSAKRNVAWTFVPNPKYDGHKASISRFVLAYETSNSAEVNALKTGTVQVGYLPLSMYSSRKQLTQDKFVETKRFVIDRTMLNFKSPTVGSAMKQLAVRKALQMGIDQKSIIKDIYDGLGTPGTGPIPLNPATFLDPKLKTPVYQFNPAAGKKLLQQNGWHEVGGVMQNSKGVKLSFNVQYPAGNTSTQAMAQLLQQDWGKEGIQIKLQPLPFATMLHYHHSPAKWDIQTGLGWSYGGTYPTGGGMFSSTGGYNFYGYSDPKMNQLVNQTHQPHATTAESQKALDAYQMYAAQQLPNLWMPVPDALTEVSKNVHGAVKYGNTFTNQISPQYWTVSGK